jgi:hypothetical protein
VTILLIVLASLIAYIAVGLKYVAPLYVTRAMEGRVRLWGQELLDSVLDREPDRLERWRREEAGWAFGVALIWPLYLAGVAAERLAGVVVRDAPLTSYELKRQTEQQAKRIAELERDLGLGKSS